MFAPQLKGRVAERLGRGLQNLVQRFKSARDLKKSLQETAGIFILNYYLRPNGILGCLTGKILIRTRIFYE